jgi:uncharacterized protein DUF4158
MNDWQSTYLGRGALPRDLSGFEIEAFFTYSESERCLIDDERRSSALKLALALQIGFLRMTGRLLEALRMVPPALWRHLGAQFEIDAPDLASLRTMYRRRRTLFEQQDLACSVLGFHDVTEAQRRALVRAINAELSRTSDRQRLLQFARRWLYDHKQIIPRERELRGYIAKAIRQHETTLVSEIVGAIDPDLLAQWKRTIGAAGCARDARHGARPQGQKEAACGQEKGREEKDRGREGLPSPALGFWAHDCLETRHRGHEGRGGQRTAGDAEGAAARVRGRRDPGRDTAQFIAAMAGPCAAHHHRDLCERRRARGTKHCGADVDVSGGVTGVDRPVATIRLYLYVENNNRHLRGKKRAIDAIVRYVLPVYGETRHLQRNEYQIKIPYRDDAELDKIVDELLYEIWWEADRGNCFSESEASLEGTDRAW